MSKMKQLQKAQIITLMALPNHGDIYKSPLLPNHGDIYKSPLIREPYYLAYSRMRGKKKGK